ncbi:hypothetical protein ECANGB1_1560 [Enterospora canceri]|uniref:40S ribosomal protein S30 n=1 Tax=Enterospora canceri TaxID=1081671 RepID=A0A1Y1S6J6_9MICR|nr:hypothetical protein ECANGB1_1560 [Enterospora canceri]
MAAVSINRAGKVRGQTPQIAKSEHPRKKTGRAAIRGKYERRMELNWFEGKGRIRLNNNIPAKEFNK